LASVHGGSSGLCFAIDRVAHLAGFRGAPPEALIYGAYHEAEEKGFLGVVIQVE
jgi:hypothetical protein